MSASEVAARLIVVTLTLTIGGGTAIAAEEVSRPTSTAVAGSPGPWRIARASDRSELDFQHVLATDIGFVALGWPRGRRQRGEAVLARTWWSHDGALWGPTAPIELTGRATVARLARLDDVLYAIGMDGPRLAVWRATADGAWRRLRDRGAFSAPPPGAGRRFSADLDAVAGGDRRIVVSGNYWTNDADPSIEPVTWTTRDGRHWRRSQPGLPPPDNAIHAIAMQPRRFIGLAATNHPNDCHSGSGSSQVLISASGRAWRRASRAFGCGADAITYDVGRGRYYALSEAPDAYADVVLSSDDLRSWSEVFRLPTTWEDQPWSPAGTGIDVVNGTIVVVGDATWDGERDGSTVLAVISDDGATWHLSVDWPMGDGRREEIEGWATDGSRLVVDAGERVWWADVATLLGAAAAPAP